MNRAIFGGSLVCVLFLLVGTFAFPSSMVMDLASTSVLITIFRIVMAVVLVGVLVTSPPRKLLGRLVMGGMAVALLALGFALSLGNSMHMLDVILFWELGCALGLEALEFNDDELAARTKQLHKSYETLQQTAAAPLDPYSFGLRLQQSKH